MTKRAPYQLGDDAGRDGSVERVYVLEPVYRQFVRAAVRDVQALRVGAGAPASHRQVAAGTH